MKFYISSFRLYVSKVRLNRGGVQQYSTMYIVHYVRYICYITPTSLMLTLYTVHVQCALVAHSLKQHL